MVGASKKRAQRNRSPSHSTSAGESTSPPQLVPATEARPSPMDGDQAERTALTELNRNIDGSVTMWAHVTGANVNIQKRPKPSTLGREIQMGINSFPVSAVPKVPVYQYDVAHGLEAKKEKRLIAKLWQSKAIKSQLPNPAKWIFDGEKIAYSTEKLDREIRVMIDLNEEEGRPPPKSGKAKTFRVVIKMNTTIRFDNLRAYLDGKADFSTTCLEAINFLDHLLREGPSHNLTPIKRNFFQSGHTERRMALGSGTQAFKGVYQSMRIAHDISGKHVLTVNVDVANGTFWIPGPLSSAIAALLRCNDASMHQAITSPMGQRELKKFRHVDVVTTHRKQPDQYKIEAIILQSANEKKLTFPGQPSKTMAAYFQEKYGRLKHPEWPVVKMTRSDCYLPLELLTIPENQRFSGKLDEYQTSQMIKFAVTPPPQRWQDIENGLRMLNWGADKYLNEYGLKINPTKVVTKARLIQAPEVQFKTNTAKPGTSGRWDLKDKKFLIPNKRPLASWGVVIMPGRQALDNNSVVRFMTNFMNAYKGHGGTITNPPLIIIPSNPDAGTAVEEGYQKTGNKFQAAPQMLIFILQTKDSTTYGRIKKSCECRFGVMSQCMQSSNVAKGQAQYISNVLMKFNAKLGGTTARAMGANTKGPMGIFKEPTMIVGADVTHPAPRSQGNVDEGRYSIAAVTTSMDLIGARYNAATDTNGFRVEMIMPENWTKLWKPSVNSWMNNCNQGKLPSTIFYFRDGVSEGQFAAVIRQELEDMRSVLKGINADHKTKFVLIVGTKRHHLRFFPPERTGDKNGNPLPGTLVETAITHPYENDFFLCSHSAIKGTARPTHYHVLVNEPGYPNEMLQTLIYEHSYQYMRSTTPVSLFPAIYYADIAADRARYHDQKFGTTSSGGTQPGRGRGEGSGSGSQSRSGSGARTEETGSSGTPTNIPNLMPLKGAEMTDGMWFI